MSDRPAALPRGQHLRGFSGDRRREPGSAHRAPAGHSGGNERDRDAGAQSGSEGAIFLGGSAPAGAAPVLVEGDPPHPDAAVAVAVIVAVIVAVVAVAAVVVTLAGTVTLTALVGGRGRP